MSTFRRRVSLAALLTLSVASCGPRVLPPDVKVNPSPKERYEITLTIEDPPAPFRIDDEWAQMDIQNGECMPMSDRIAGIKPDSTFHQPFALKQTAADTYVGYIYADYFLDEDYYAQGVCRWEITKAHALIHIEGIEQSASLDGDFVIGQKAELNLCRRPSTDPVSPDLCSRPSDGNATDENKKFNYIVILKSRKVMP